MKDEKDPKTGFEDDDKYQGGTSSDEDATDPPTVAELAVNGCSKRSSSGQYSTVGYLVIAKTKSRSPEGQ